jgi:molybdate transport system substrate-binding protein
MMVNGLVWLIITIASACSTPPDPHQEAGATPIGSVAADADQTKTVTVFAAASLTDAFQDIARRFEAAYPGSKVTINFAGSQRLALMLEQGAIADVFASADQRSMDKLVATGLVQRDAPSIFARNQMVVIVPAGNPGQIQALKDLARPDLRLILAGEQVPAGAYARQVLENLAADPAYGAEFKDAVLRNVVSNEENVKQVVAKVRLGEADAGIVYQSDMTSSSADELPQIDIPDRFNIVADYPIAVLGSAPGNDLARQFVQFVLAPEGQVALERWGLIGFHR